MNEPARKPRLPVLAYQYVSGSYRLANHGWQDGFAGVDRADSRRVYVAFCAGSESLSQVTPMPRYALETVILVLLVLWLLGAFVVPIGTNLIHLVLVVVLIVLVFRMLQGRRPLR